MDEARPLSSRARWTLRVALVIAWATGVAGTVTSCGVLAHYRGPRPHRSTTTAVASASAPASASASAFASVAGSAPASASVLASASASVEAPAVASVEAPASAVASVEAPASASVVASVESSAAPPVVAAPAVSTQPSVSPPKASGQPFFSEAEADIVIDSFERFRKTKLPLTAANFVLSIALVIGAARTIGRRPGGRVWLQQVCVATVLYAVAEYGLSRDERAFLMEHLPAAGAARVQASGLTREQAEAAIRLQWKISAVVRLMGQLVLYGGLAIALGRRSVELELATDSGNRRSVPPPPSSDDEES